MAHVVMYFVKRVVELFAPCEVLMMLLVMCCSSVYYVSKGVVGVISSWNLPISHNNRSTSSS
jgi:hypothetical protein